jgi:hypothetical protein
MFFASPLSIGRKPVLVAKFHLLLFAGPLPLLQKIYTSSSFFFLLSKLLSSFFPLPSSSSL